MTFLVNSFWSNAAAFYQYAMQNGSGSDIYDPGNLASSGSFVVPASWNGRRVRAMMGFHSNVNSTQILECLKGGSSFVGAGKATITAITGADESGYAQSAPIVVSTGDTFTFPNGGGNNGSWRTIEVMPAGHVGALVNRVTSSFSVGTASTAIEFNNEVYDDNGYHDNGTDPARLTIPSGTGGLVRFMGNVELDASTELGLALSGSFAGAGIELDTVGASASIMSWPIIVTAGNYATLNVRTNAVRSALADDNTWFAVEELDPALQYCVLSGASGSIPSGSTWTAFNGGSEVADVGGWSSSSSSFVVPSGVTQVRMGFFIQSSNTLGSAWTIGIFKNGAEFAEMPINGTTNANVENSHAVSGIMQCVAGDTFTFRAKTGAGSMAVAGGRVWIEEVPAVTS